MTLVWDPYATLGVARNADEVTIRAAYRLRALECHPDRPGGSTTRMQSVNRAFGILSNPRSRVGWDAATVAKADPDVKEQARPERCPPSFNAQTHPPRWTEKRDERNGAWTGEPEPATRKPPFQAPSRSIAMGLRQWSGVAVFVAGLQELTIGGGGTLMAVAAVVLAVHGLGSGRSAGQPFWPIRDVETILRTTYRTVFAGER